MHHVSGTSFKLFVNQFTSFGIVPNCLPGLSGSYKKIFKYTPIQVCFKGVNTLKSLLMHPKDKISTDQKEDIVYHWECQVDGCNSSYIGETSRALGERVKETSMSTTSAILKH